MVINSSNYVIKWKEQGTEEQVLCDPTCIKRRMAGWPHMCLCVHMLSDGCVSDYRSR